MSGLTSPPTRNPTAGRPRGTLALLDRLAAPEKEVAQPALIAS
jgi:hypothetical protein